MPLPADGSLRAVGARLRFRPLARTDLPLLARWIGRAHVKRWFSEPGTVAAVEREYGGELRGDDRIRVFIAELDGAPVGMIQAYRVEDFRDDPDASTSEWDADGCVGIDYLIGERRLTRRGLGTAMIERFLETVVRVLFAGAVAVVADPDRANLASIGALRALGFREHRVVPDHASGRPLQLMRRPL